MLLYFGQLILNHQLPLNKLFHHARSSEYGRRLNQYIVDYLHLYFHRNALILYSKLAFVCHIFEQTQCTNNRHSYFTPASRVNIVLHFVFTSCIFRIWESNLCTKTFHCFPHNLHNLQCWIIMWPLMNKNSVEYRLNLKSMPDYSSACYLNHTWAWGLYINIVQLVRL